VRAADVAAALAKMPPEQARIYLARLYDRGELSRHGRGLYTPVTSVSSVTSGNTGQPERDTSNASNTPMVGTLDAWSTQLDGRCQHCGWHVVTQGHAAACDGNQH